MQFFFVIRVEGRSIERFIEREREGERETLHGARYNHRQIRNTQPLWKFLRNLLFNPRIANWSIGGEYAVAVPIYRNRIYLAVGTLRGRIKGHLISDQMSPFSTCRIQSEGYTSPFSIVSSSLPLHLASYIEDPVILKIFFGLWIYIFFILILHFFFSPILYQILPFDHSSLG